MPSTHYRFENGKIMDGDKPVQLDSLICEFRGELIRTRGEGGKWTMLAAALLHERDAQEQLPPPERLSRGTPRAHTREAADPTLCPTTGKRRYASAHAGREANRHNSARLRAYPCPDCGDIHMTREARRDAR